MLRFPGMAVSRINSRLDKVHAVTVPGTHCVWCRHPKGEHRGGRVCERAGCRCLRVG